MNDGNYIFVGYISGNNGQSDYTFATPASNSVVVGKNEANCRVFTERGRAR